MRDRDTLVLLWALPIALSLHVCEEFAFPGGLMKWIRKYNPEKPKGNLYYFIINAAGIVAAAILALKAHAFLGFRLYLYSVAIMAANGVSHISVSLQRKACCPGTVTGSLLLLPLSVAAFSFFLSSGKTDVASALVCAFSGFVMGFYVVGMGVRKARTKFSALSLVLPATVLLLLLLPSPAATQRIDVHDGFETSSLSDVWETSRFERGAVEIQTNIFRSGHSAAQITVRSRDKFEAGQNGDSDSERAELLEATALTSREDHSYEYAFSMLIPTNFPIVPTRLVIAQWKQYCPGSPICSDDSPVLAIRYQSGVLKITQNFGRGPHTTLYAETNEFRGHWLDFKFQIRFATNETGRVKAWLDDRQIVNFTGSTANPETTATGYRHPGRFYFKMGLYRNVMPEPMTSYIDEYRKKELADIDP